MALSVVTAGAHALLASDPAFTLLITSTVGAGMGLRTLKFLGCPEKITGVVEDVLYASLTGMTLYQFFRLFQIPIDQATKVVEESAHWADKVISKEQAEQLLSGAITVKKFLSMFGFLKDESGNTGIFTDSFWLSTFGFVFKLIMVDLIDRFCTDLKLLPPYVASAFRRCMAMKLFVQNLVKSAVVGVGHMVWGFITAHFGKKFLGSLLSSSLTGL